MRPALGHSWSVGAVGTASRSGAWVRDQNSGGPEYSTTFRDNWDAAARETPGLWKCVQTSGAVERRKGVTAKDVVDSTGFAVNVPNGCPETRAPTQQEVDLIKRIDPTGIHLLDFISGKERATRLPANLQAEWDGV